MSNYDSTQHYFLRGCLDVTFYEKMIDMGKIHGDIKIKNLE